MHALCVRARAWLRAMCAPLCSPGQYYYARYDGGMDVAANENSGVSSVIVGRGIAGDVVQSLVCAPHAGTLRGLRVSLTVSRPRS